MRVRLLRSVPRPAFALALLVSLGAAPAAGQDQAALIEMARQGQVENAWRTWRAMPASAERSRAGVALAAATGDVSQGLAVYEELQRQIGGPDYAALAALAVAAARGVADSADHESRVTACAVILQDDSAHQPCWDVVRAVRANHANPSQQALDAFRMADAGFRPWPDLIEQATAQLSVADRVDVARRFTRLPAAERVALAAPGLESADALVRRRTASVLGDVRGPEAMTVLRNAFDATEDLARRVTLAVPLARHGDAEGVALLQQVRAGLIGPLAIDANMALAAVGDRSATPPQSLLAGAPPSERGRIAVAVASRAREAAEAAVREMLRDSSPEVRAEGFRAAGAIGLGDDHVVYGQLSQADPAVRVGAILAVMDAAAGGATRARQVPSDAFWRASQAWSLSFSGR